MFLGDECDLESNEIESKPITVPVNSTKKNRVCF